MASIAERFKDLRLTHKLTQKEFGERILVTPSYVSKLEAGKEVPSGVLVKLAALEFNVSYEWLSNGEGLMQLLPDKHDVLERGFSKHYKDLFYPLIGELIHAFEKIDDSMSTHMDITVIIGLLTNIFNVKTKTNAQKNIIISAVTNFIIELEDKIQRCANANPNDKESINNAIVFARNMKGFEIFLDEIVDVFFSQK